MTEVTSVDWEWFLGEQKRLQRGMSKRLVTMEIFVLFSFFDCADGEDLYKAHIMKDYA